MSSLELVAGIFHDGKLKNRLDYSFLSKVCVFSVSFFLSLTHHHAWRSGQGGISWSSAKENVKFCLGEEQPHAPVRAGGWPGGKQPFREGSAGSGGPQIGHGPSMQCWCIGGFIMRSTLRSTWSAGCSFVLPSIRGMGWKSTEGPWGWLKDWSTSYFRRLREPGLFTWRGDGPS